MTAPTNLFNAGTNSGIQAFVNAVTALIPTSVPSPTAPGQNQTFSGFDFQGSKGFKIELEVTPDGQTLLVTCSPKDQGQNNAFGPTNPNPIVNGVTHYGRANALKVPGNLL